MRWRNLFSYGNAWTEISLDTGEDTLLVGTNGAGKSTFLDALCFALFGKPFRQVNKARIPNSINQKGTEVIVEFEKSGRKYAIARGIKPDHLKLWINGEESDKLARVADQQKLIEAVVGFNLKSFTQVVVLGSATYQPFMQLKTAARREFVEDLLDVGIIGEMATVIRKKAGVSRSGERDIEREVAVLRERLDGKREKLRAAEDAQSFAEDKLRDELDDTRKRFSEVDATRAAAEERVDKARTARQLVDDAQRTVTLCKDSLKGMARRVKEAQARVDDLRAGGSNQCGECGSDLGDESRERAVSVAVDSVSAAKAESKNVLARMDSAQKVLDESGTDHEDLDPATTALADIRAEIKALAQKGREISEEIEGFSQVHPVDDVRVEVEDAEKCLETGTDALAEARSELAHLDSAGRVLADDGVKAKIVADHLPLINKLVNDYLEYLGFNISFHLDDQFSEEIRSRGRDNFTYYSFSEGEKRRIDLALLFAWRDIARMRNSASTNIIVMDEVMDGSLDSSGTDDFVGIVHGLPEGTTAFVISHNPEFVTRFPRVLRAEKSGGFSSLVDATPES